MWFTLFVLVASSPLCFAGRLTSLVNTLYASRGGAGFGGWGNEARNPGAMAPTPLLRLGPDTTRVDPLVGEVWSKLNRHGGFFGSDNAVRAFSLTHLQGAGDADLGTVGLMVSRADGRGVAAGAALRPLDLPGLATVDRSPWRAAYAAAHVAAAASGAA